MLQARVGSGAANWRITLLRQAALPQGQVNARANARRPQRGEDPSLVSDRARPLADDVLSHSVFHLLSAAEERRQVKKGTNESTSTS